jgi:DNA-binding protein YbaB
MFDKLKELNQLRKAQGEIQKELENILITTEKDGVKLVIRGDKKVERVEIDGDDNKLFKDLINAAMKEVDKKVEKQMRGRLSDLGLPGF